MCEVNAYLLKDGKEWLLLEKVYKLETTDDQIHIENLFGEQKFVNLSLKEIDFDRNRLVFVEPEEVP
jgi:predicted RNA-binding protein